MKKLIAVSCSPGLVRCLGISSMCLVSGACMHLFWVKIMVCVFFCEVTLLPRWRGGGLLVSVLGSGASGPGSSPGRGHCVVFLAKTLYSHSASLHPGV